MISRSQHSGSGNKVSSVETLLYRATQGNATSVNLRTTNIAYECYCIKWQMETEAHSSNPRRGKQRHCISDDAIRTAQRCFVSAFIASGHGNSASRDVAVDIEGHHVQRSGSPASEPVGLATTRLSAPGKRQQHRFDHAEQLSDTCVVYGTGNVAERSCAHHEHF